MPIEEPTVLTISVLRGPTPHYEVYPGAEICDGALVTGSSLPLECLVTLVNPELMFISCLYRGRFQTVSSGQGD